MNEEDDKQRIEERLVPVHHQSSNYDILGDNVYFPANHKDLRSLLGDLLTILDGMNLPDRTYKATRANITQATWRWWDDIYSNTTTSYRGCIAPVVMQEAGTSDPKEPSNRWGWDSEDEYTKSVTPRAAGIKE